MHAYHPVPVDTFPVSDVGSDPTPVTVPATAPGSTRDDGAPGPGKVSRLRGQQEKITRRVETTYRQIEGKRGDSLTIDAAFRAARHDNVAGGTVLAGAVAFRVFLFLIPYVFVLVLLFGDASSIAKQDPHGLAKKAGIGGLIAQSVKVSSSMSTFTRISSLAVGVFALFLASRSLLKVMRIVHGLVWGVRPKKPKSTTKQALFLCLVTTLFILGAMGLGYFRQQSLLLGLVAMLLAGALPVGLWILVSWHLPHKADSWRDLLPGAVLFGVGVLVLHVVTVYWIARLIADRTDTYGAIGAALALLLWAYLLGRVITSAAVLNATLWQKNHEGEPA